MESVSTDRTKAAQRQQLASDIRDSLRELRIQLALLNYRVGSQVELKDVDLDCLDIIDARGPISPSELARRAGLHPATLTGILDRLEKGGWIARERDPSDRRAVVVRSLHERFGELLGHYQGLARSMNTLLGTYSESELELIAGFLQSTVEAGREATDAFALEGD